MPQDTTRDSLNLQTTRIGDPAPAQTLQSLLVPGLTVVAHPDFRRIGEQVALHGLVSGKKAELSRLRPEFSQSAGVSRPRPLNDPFLSRNPLKMCSGTTPGSIRIERANSRTQAWLNGEEIFESRTVSAKELEAGALLVLGQRVALLLQLVDPLPPDLPAFDLVGESVSMRQLRREIRTAAALDTPVLLRGETGTGKELVARALHEHGPRRKGPFVAVNMAALPPTLAASELFGAARGAYTGADRKKSGLFQSAAGGTLFLDEIGEAPIEVQAMLLRALETREVQAVGSVESEKIDVRVLAATDADLDQAIQDKEFRAPLLHRLAGYDIRLPALRTRPDDVSRLFFHFFAAELSSIGRLELLRDRENPCLPCDLITQMVTYPWPGNVRQLGNVARRMAVTCREPGGETKLGSVLDSLLDSELSSVLPEGTGCGLPASPQLPTAQSPNHPGARLGPYRKAQEVNDEELLEVLRANDWNLRRTAETLHVSRPTLYRLIDACSKIRKASELSSEEIEAALLAAGKDAGKAAKQLEVSPQGFQRRLTELGLR